MWMHPAYSACCPVCYPHYNKGPHIQQLQQQILQLHRKAKPRPACVSCKPPIGSIYSFTSVSHSRVNSHSAGSVLYTCHLSLGTCTGDQKTTTNIAAFPKPFTGRPTSRSCSWRPCMRLQSDTECSGSALIAAAGVDNIRSILCYAMTESREQKHIPITVRETDQQCIYTKGKNPRRCRDWPLTLGLTLGVLEGTLGLSLQVLGCSLDLQSPSNIMIWACGMPVVRLCWLDKYGRQSMQLQHICWCNWTSCTQSGGTQQAPYVNHGGEQERK